MTGSPLGIPRRDWIALGVVALAITAAPFALSRYQLSVLATVGMFGIAAVGLCLLGGYARQVSLGHAAFYGLGAYVSGLVALRLGWSPWLTMPLAGLAAAVVAVVVGAPVLRLHGHYLAMATLGLGIIFQVVLNELTDVTGGPSGVPGIPAVPLAWLPVNGEARSLYLIWAVGLGLLALALWLVNARAGRTLRAIGESELAAELLGVNTATWKVLVFALSAVYAGLAGALYAHYVTFLSPAPFGFIFSLELLVMAAVGGLASVWGGFIGAAVVVILIEALRALVPGSGGEIQPILFGLALVAIMIARPSGIAGLGRTALDRVRLVRRAPVHASPRGESAASEVARVQP